MVQSSAGAVLGELQGPREAHAGSVGEEQRSGEGIPHGTEEGTDHGEAADKVLGTDCSLHSSAILWEEEVEEYGWGKVF